LQAVASQYKDRFRPGSQQKILINVHGKRYPYRASVEKIMGGGKAVKLHISCEMDNKPLDVVSLVMLGPEDPSLADSIKVETILNILKGSSEVINGAIPKCLWFNDEVPEEVVPPHPEFLDEFGDGMNERQREALKLMLSESRTIQLPIIIGPPGTGKTTVISAFTRALAASNCPVWVVAQSNVGVKNIASRLMKDDFMDWRLLISKDFYNGWYVSILNYVWIMRMTHLIITGMKICIERFRAGIK